MGTLVDIFGHTPVDSLMTTTTMVNTTVPVPSTLVTLPLPLYCESGITGQWQDNRRIALEDPLWDGDGCGPDNNCCAQAGMRGSVGPSHRK